MTTTPSTDVELLIHQELADAFEPLAAELAPRAEVLGPAAIKEHLRRLRSGYERPTGPQLLIAPAEAVEGWIAGEDPLPAEIAFLAVTPHPVFPAWATDEAVADVVTAGTDERMRELAVKRAALHTDRRLHMDKLLRKSSLQERQLHELNRIGTALSTEHNLDNLLEMIVSKAREVTAADAGSLYLVDRDADGEPLGTLHFKVAQNDSLDLDFSAFRMDIDRQSIAGYVALEGDILNLPDVYELPEDVEYTFNRSFDESTGYRSKSMLVVPMKSHKHQITGVLQLINKKHQFQDHLDLDDNERVERQVKAFSANDEELVSSLASQAAIAIENAQLYEDIQRQFESFIYASVSAIEARDPTTSGHSERVATLTVGLAEAVNRVGRGELARTGFSDQQLREIHYAGLLHDFGKIGVREHVLVKAKKLYPEQQQHVQDRYRAIRKAMKLKVAHEVIEAFLKGSKADAKKKKQELERWLDGELEQLDEHLGVIMQANEPSILPGDTREELEELLEMSVEDPDEGDELPLLLPDEYINLTIPKGSLNDEERREIESHVTHTYKFLRLIPWTRELSDVAEIAYGHHEKLDGTGYPRGVDAPEIPVQTRMMTISDIFDALTATDRPYKRAVPVNRALDILGMEVDEGKLDPELYDVFLEAKIFERVPAGQQKP